MAELNFRVICLGKIIYLHVTIISLRDLKKRDALGMCHFESFPRTPALVLTETFH